MEPEKARAAKEGKTGKGTGGEGSGGDNFPVRIVVVEKMPVGALVEIELVCATSKARKIGIFDEDVEGRWGVGKTDGRELESTHVTWPCGYGEVEGGEGGGKAFPICPSEVGDIAVDCKVRFIPGCMGMVWCDAKAEGICSSGQVVFKTMSTVAEAVRRTKMKLGNLLHVRVYCMGMGGKWNPQEIQDAFDYLRKDRDGVGWEFAVSVVPVKGLAGNVDITTQCIACDLVHTETEMWLKSNDR